MDHCLVNFVRALNTIYLKKQASFVDYLSDFVGKAKVIDIKWSASTERSLFPTASGSRICSDSTQALHLPLESDKETVFSIHMCSISIFSGAQAVDYYMPFLNKHNHRHHSNH